MILAAVVRDRQDLLAFETAVKEDPLEHGLLGHHGSGSSRLVLFWGLRLVQRRLAAFHIFIPRFPNRAFESLNLAHLFFLVGHCD